jgi:hypothetical protein
MLRCLSVVDNDGNGPMGNDDNDDNNIDDDGTMGDDDNDDQDGTTDNKFDDNNGNGAMDHDTNNDCDGATGDNNNDEYNATDGDINNDGNGATDDNVDDVDGNRTTDGDRTMDDDVDNNGYGTTNNNIDDDWDGAMDGRHRLDACGGCATKSDVRRRHATTGDATTSRQTRCKREEKHQRTRDDRASTGRGCALRGGGRVERMRGGGIGLPTMNGSP